jgi:hypothetical protein
MNRGRGRALRGSILDNKSLSGILPLFLFSDCNIYFLTTERFRNCRQNGYRRPQRARQIVHLSGVSPRSIPGMSRAGASVDRTITENRKTPDRSSICRASAQEAFPECREIPQLSTKRLPKTAKYLTDRPSVGRQPRKHSRNVES